MWTADADKFAGPVEVDETYIGGKERNKHEYKKQHAGRGQWVRRRLSVSRTGRRGGLPLPLWSPPMRPRFKFCGVQDGSNGSGLHRRR